MKRYKHVKTAIEVIEICGGTRVVADRLGDEYPAVWNWRKRGLPPDTYLAFRKLLRENRAIAPPELWSMRPVLPR